MTTNTGMPALETWVRQLNGELQVEKYSKKTEVMETKEDIVKEYYTGLRQNKSAYMNQTNSPKIKTNFRPNIRVIFDKDTWKVKAVELVEVGTYRSKHE